MSESATMYLVRQNDEKHEAGHKRLRNDLRGHDQRLDDLEKLTQDLGYKVNALQTAPQDFSKLSLTPGVVVTIIITIGGIIAGQLASTWGLRSDVRDINTKIEAQTNRTQDNQRLQDERFTSMRSQIEGFDKKQELQRLEIQGLKETILEQRRRP